jgi:uncharacterized membrane protein
MSTTTSTRRPAWRVPALLILLSAVPAAAGIARLAQLAGGAELAELGPAEARFFAMPIPVVIHILAVIPFSILGAFQFVPSLRRGTSSWHRIVGRLLAPLGLVAALSGLWMTQFYPWIAPDGVAVYLERLVFGWAMVVSIVIGLDAVRRRDFAAHGNWMLRAYAIGMGAGTQVFTHLPWFILVGKPGVLPRAVMMGAGWAINVIVAEWIIRKGRVGKRSDAARRPRVRLHLVEHGS